MPGTFDKDMTAQLEAPAPSLPKPKSAEAPRVVPPVTEAEMKSAQITNLALGIAEHLRSTGDTCTLEGIAHALGEDIARLRPALKLAVDHGQVTQNGEVYAAFVAGALGGWNRR